MKYSLLLMTDPDDGSCGKTAEEIVSIEYPEIQPAIRQKIIDSLPEFFEKLLSNRSIAGMPESLRFGAPRGRPGRSITITEVENPQTAPAGIRVGEVIHSSMTLSRMLGYDYNMATQALCRAAANRKRELAALPLGEDGDSKRASLMAYVVEAKLRGVTFCYTDEAAGTGGLN